MANHKNDYTIKIWERNGVFLGEMTFVHNLFNASKWLTASRNYTTWMYFNVYDRRNPHIYLGRFYRNGFIPPFL